MFVTTANTLNLPQPLLDRMEIIRLEGYTEDEKVEIAERHLIAKQIEAHGLKDGEFDADRRGPARADPALHARGRRPHARARDRQAGAQGAAPDPRRQGRRRSTITPDNLGEFAGVRKYPPRHGRGRGPDRRGHRPRLDRGRRRIADDRERSPCPARAQIKTTGKLGDVMKESVAGRVQLRQGARAQLRHQAEPVRAQGHPRPSARRRGAQGRAVGGHRHGHRDRLDADRRAGAARRGDDRRGHAARPRAADRRAEGEAARGAARRHHDGADPGRRTRRISPKSRRTSAKGWRSSRSPCRRGARLGAGRRRSSRSNGPRPTSWRRCRRRRARRAPASASLASRSPPLIAAARNGRAAESICLGIGALSFDSLSALALDRRFVR